MIPPNVFNTVELSTSAYRKAVIAGDWIANELYWMRSTPLDVRTRGRFFRSAARTPDDEMRSQCLPAHSANRSRFEWRLPRSRESYRVAGGGCPLSGLARAIACA